MARELVDILQRAVLLCGLALAVVVMGLGTGCAPLVTAQNGPTIQLDPDVDDELGGNGIESRDIRGASERVSRRLSKMQHESDRPRIAMLPVVNLTRFRIDPGLLKNRLAHDLVNRANGRFEIIPLSNDDGASGATVDYVLKTELRSETKDNLQGTKSDYVQYAFTLLRPTDGALLWSEMYETKRMSDVDVIYQ